MWNTVFDEKLALSFAHDQMDGVAEAVRAARRWRPVEAQSPAAGSVVSALRSQAALVEPERRDSMSIAAEA